MRFVFARGFAPVTDLACNSLQTLAKIVPEMCDHRSPQGEGADP